MLLPCFAGSQSLNLSPIRTFRTVSEGGLSETHRTSEHTMLLMGLVLVSSPRFSNLQTCLFKVEISLNALPNFVADVPFAPELEQRFPLCCQQLLP